MELFTTRMRLREFELPDWQLLYRWSRDPEQTRYDSTPNLTRVRARQIVDSILMHRRRQPRQQYDFVMESLGNDGVIGTVYAAIRDPRTRRVEIGYRVDFAYWNRGFATEAARRMVEFARSVMQAEEVFARVVVGNTGSVRVLEKLGMTQIHTNPYGVFREGNWRPMATYSMRITNIEDIMIDTQAGT